MENVSWCQQIPGAHTYVIASKVCNDIKRFIMTSKKGKVYHDIKTYAECQIVCYDVKKYIIMAKIMS